MPPKPSLPLRDGRLGSSSSHIGSSQHQNEPYYSNEDINLLHEIVTAGEEILPTLPERDQLATNALFQAAEQVLPAHGYDPDHAPSNISRLIFKIGGLRSEGSLMDKFSSVLGGMGINLEFVDPAEQQQQPDSSSVKSSASAAISQTGTFSVSPRYKARRRRNSESAAPTVPIEDLRAVPTTFESRARSASFGSQHGDELLSFRARNDENRPPRQHVQTDKGKAAGVEREDAGHQDPRPLPFRLLRAPEDDTDDGFPYRRRHVEQYPASESADVDEYSPSDIYQGQLDHEYDLPEVESIPDHYGGSSDTMAQTSDELPSEPVLSEEDRDFMEGDVQDFQNHFARRQASATLSKWREEARTTAQRHQHQEARAALHDRMFVLAEAVTVWRDAGEAARRERVASQGPIRDPEADAEMERRATRGYHWVILSKAFVHWYRSSQDEVERTAIARRYILRRRYFGAWRAHQADIEANIHTFRLRTLLRIWRRAAIHQEVRESVAVQRYGHDLAKHVFRTWWDIYRAGLADDYRVYHLKEDYLLIWQREAGQFLVDLGRSRFEADRYLLAEAVYEWTERVDEFRGIEHGCTRQKILIDLQKALQEWKTLAQLSKKSREFSEERDHWAKCQVIDHWIAQAGEADQKALLSTKLFLQEFIAHWRNEAKLGRFQGQEQRALKLEVITHWRLDHKLNSYQRMCERRTKERVLGKLRRAATGAQAETVDMLQTADIVRERREKASVLGRWRRRTVASLDRQDTAADRHYFCVASSYLERWYKRAGEEGARTADLEGFAARGAYYVATSNVLQTWSETTKQSRKERLTKSYHTFRRRYKVRLAGKCLSRWRAATHDSHSRSYDADSAYGGYLRDELADCVQLWRNATDMVQVVREVAQTADQEVWWGNWSRRAKDLGETTLDAAEFADEQTLSRCWRTWEYAILQHKGGQHVVATLQENNDRRLCRQVLSHWSQKAAPGGTYPDLRSSVASRRSVRYGNVRAVDTPRFGSSVNPPPSSQTTVVQLPEIEEDIYTATPRRQFGRVSEPARNPFVSAPKDLSASLPHRPTPFSKRDSPPIAATPQVQPPISSFPASAGLPPTGSLPPSTQRPPSRQQYQATPYPQPGPQPKPDFDDDEISFHPSEGNEFPATFMSTPTRWTGTARPLSAGGQPPPQQQQPFRRPATGMPITSTPSALLDTPYERALRREYGGSGILGSSERRLAGGGGGVGWMAATPRVTFADIREESGEVTYEEEDVA